MLPFFSGASFDAENRVHFMPVVILTEPEEWETWLTAPAEEALKLPRPLPDDALHVVAKGERNDEAPALA
jgi:putative SOS response-associated peptidase YedK